MKKIALIGNPNCGKTTLFNALTGHRQRVGNWPGVTVSKKTGTCALAADPFEVIDLPGIYQLNASDQDAIDEKIAYEFIEKHQADGIIHLINSAQLERQLYLTSQLVDSQTPMIIVLTMGDIAQKVGRSIDPDTLSKQLGVPVIALKGYHPRYLKPLLKQIQQSWQVPHPTEYCQPLEQTLCDLIKRTASPSYSRNALLQALETPQQISSQALQAIHEHCQRKQHALQQDFKAPIDLIIANERYQWAHQIATATCKHTTPKKSSLNQSIDNIVLNRIFGIPCFLMVMYALFFFALHMGGIFQDFFDLGSLAIFVEYPKMLLQHMHAPPMMIAVIAEGFGRGLNTLLSFIPIMSALFFALTFLEQTGYMARAALMVDKAMRQLGLPGKAFVPLVVGFGCNVPTVLGSRILQSPKERALTILMSPFMSCGARLSVYVLFASAFFPNYATPLIFGLYLFGIIAALITAWVLKLTLFKGPVEPLVMELPRYHLPSLKSLLQSTWSKLKQFLMRAGKIIVPMVMVLGLLGSITPSGQLTEPQNPDSVLATFSHRITPLFKPMGIEQNNWPAVVGIVSGVMAKEVVVGTLNALYGQMGGLSAQQSLQPAQTLSSALQSIPDNIQNLGYALLHPLRATAKAPAEDSERIYGAMVKYFNGTAGALAYLLFILLYFPCVSTLAAIKGELGGPYAIAATIYPTVTAYACSSLLYQWLTTPLAVQSNLLTTLSWLLGFVGLILILKFVANDNVHAAHR